jgi:RNA-directed DNA polymerase
MRAKLNKVKEWIKKIKDKQPLKQIWKTFVSKLRGHVNYYGVSHNSENVSKFLSEAKKIVFKWLNRRSQRKSCNWRGPSVMIAHFNIPCSRIMGYWE